MSKILNSQLTKKQAQLFDYLDKFEQKNNYSPALSDMAKHFDVSIPTIHQHVDYLKRKGYLIKEKGVKNSIRILKHMSDLAYYPELQQKTKHGFRTIDLFAGVGGIRIGFENAGFETIFSNDFDEQCKKTYNLNFSTAKLVVEDIRKIELNDLPEFDFLLGGFPCQAFSIAGYRQGFSDKKGRGNLFFDIARIIEARKPEGFLLENVKNLKSHDGGKTFKVIMETLKNLGYYVKAQVLNTMEYGNIPQNRERIYIVGFKNKDYYNRFEFPDPVKLTTKIITLLEKDVPEKYYYNDKPLFEKLKNFVK